MHPLAQPGGSVRKFYWGFSKERVSDVAQVCLFGKSPATVTYGIYHGMNEDWLFLVCVQ